MDKDKSVLIKINSMDELQSFAFDVMNFSSEIDLVKDSHCVDAKSIMCIMAMNIREPLYVEILSDDKNEINLFKKIMNKYKEDNNCY